MQALCNVGCVVVASSRDFFHKCRPNFLVAKCFHF
nr:MAG TPA: hypothetical protein [Caudoviricetes sp.]